MPVYQYACTECDEQLEVRQSFTDDALTVCPACEGRLRKVLSAVGVVFKGSGFYRTDSRAASSKSASGTTAKSDSGTTTKSDSSGSKEGGSSKESSTTKDGSSDSSAKGSGKSSGKERAA